MQSHKNIVFHQALICTRTFCQTCTTRCWWWEACFLLWDRLTVSDYSSHLSSLLREELIALIWTPCGTLDPFLPVASLIPVFYKCFLFSALSFSSFTFTWFPLWRSRGADDAPSFSLIAAGGLPLCCTFSKKCKTWKQKVVFSNKRIYMTL